jgi:transcriptional regulator with XRE-family HTH domain
MAARLKPLAPDTSPRNKFGAELRRWRERRGLSQRRLADTVLHSEETVSKVERAERWPTKALAQRCDRALATGGVLVAMWPTVEEQRLSTDGRHRRNGQRSSGEEHR